MLLTPKKSLKPQSAWLSLKVVLVSAPSQAWHQTQGCVSANAGATP